MQRRGFLNLILANASARAFVKADTLMKIWMPSQKIWLSDNLTLTEAIARQTLESLKFNLYAMGSIQHEWRGDIFAPTNGKITIKQPALYVSRIL